VERVKGVVVVGGRELERAEDAKFRFTPSQHWIWREPRTARSVSSSSIRRWTTHRYVLSIIIVIWHRYICIYYIYCLSHADICARRSCRTIHSCAPIPMAAGITPYGTGTGTGTGTDTGTRRYYCLSLPPLAIPVPGRMGRLS
jgi:hypothetical protein